MRILDLCGGTGSWSKPYLDAGYDVELIDLPIDVRLLHLPRDVHGVLAAPPCTFFAVSGNRWKRTEDDYREALSVVDACLRIVLMCKPAWWCLENPIGTLSRWIGKPKYVFHPYHHGDPYKKRTCLWGDFTIPARTPVEPLLGSVISKWTSAWKVKRSITPPGFASAFFAANK